MICYEENIPLATEQLIALYSDANWTAYTKDPNKLIKAVSNSLCVISAWDSKRLVGLIRVVGDGQTILYIQDILVLKKYKKQKIGSTLVQKVMGKYPDIRQTVLLTDDSLETRGFYENLGFQSCDKGELVSFAKFR
jgi:ribosomal protein S18 acetylase RimI-like enzyme